MRNEGVLPAVLVLEGICLAFELFHGFSRLRIAKLTLSLPSTTKDAKSAFRELVFLNLILVVMIIDWILMMSIKFSIQYFFPFRGIVVVLLIPEVR